MPGPNVWPLSIGNSIYDEGVTGTPTGTWSAPAVTSMIGSATATSSSQVSGYSTPLARSQKVQSPSSNVLTTPAVTSEAAAETTSTLSSSSQITDSNCGTVTITTTTTTTIPDDSRVTTESACVPDKITTTTTVTIFATGN
jgi:hypothetical protein